MQSETSVKLPLKAASLKFVEGAPFDEHDAFGRRPIIERLTELLATFKEDPFVLAVNEPWGSGKSTFLEMWRLHLSGLEFKHVYFNAWENDFSGDAFAALLSDFRKLVDKSESKTSAGKKAWNALRKHGVAVLRRAAAGVVRSTTAGILDLDADVENALGTVAEKAIEHSIEACESGHQAVEEFREHLRSYVATVVGAKAPLFFFVDELDRCRPTFAINVLERIKHLLNVPGIVFVFAWDKNQLNATIKTIYGSHSDPSGYLLRFIDLEFDLPKGSPKQFCKALISRFRLVAFFRQPDMGDVPLVILERLFPSLAKGLELTLREQEKAFTLIAIYSRLIKPRQHSVMHLACLLAVLRIKHSQVFQCFASLDENVERLIFQDLPQLLGGEVWLSRDGGYIEGEIIASIRNRDVADKFEERLAKRPGSSEQSLEAQRFWSLKEGVSMGYDVGTEGAVESVMARIAFAQRFVS